LFGAAGYAVSQLLQLARLLTTPLDAILIYGFSACIALPFVLALLALHYITPADRRFWTHAAVLVASMYAVYVNLNYVVQLATVIPAKLRGDALAQLVVDQTPHSLFWDADALGYICMGLAMLLAAPVLSAAGEQRWLRIFFIANGALVPLLAIVYFYPVFSISLLLLASPWLIAAPGAILLLLLHFRRELALAQKSPVH
jgi:hypothetical protein